MVAPLIYVYGYNEILSRKGCWGYLLHDSEKCFYDLLEEPQPTPLCRLDPALDHACPQWGQQGCAETQRRVPHRTACIPCGKGWLLHNDWTRIPLREKGWTSWVDGWGQQAVRCVGAHQKLHVCIWSSAHFAQPDCTVTLSSNLIKRCITGA